MAISVVTLEPARWKEYKELRLHAAVESPNAFKLSKPEIDHFPDTFWKTELETAQEEINHWLYFAIEGKQLVGVVGARRDWGLRKSHVAIFYGVYVHEAFRGQGISDQLMHQLITALEKHPTIMKLKLGVNIHQKAAINLNSKLGFRTIGFLAKELNCEGEYQDEYLMERMVEV